MTATLATAHTRLDYPQLGHTWEGVDGCVHKAFRARVHQVFKDIMFCMLAFNGNTVMALNTQATTMTRVHGDTLLNRQSGW